jgi:NodT family efflux transporter outer membrane factor (OMF) lipoprotein
MTRYRLLSAPLALLALCLTGCLVGPDYEKKEPPSPTAFTEPEGRGVASRPAELDGWWSLYKDAELDALIERAYANNLDFKIAEARVREARALVTIAQSGLFPHLNANAAYRYQRISQNGLAGSLGSGGIPNFERDQNLYDVGFDATWEIDVFGAIRRGVEAAEAIAEATVEDRRVVLVSLLGEVARVYVECRGFQAQLDISQSQLRTQVRSVELTQARVNAGLSSELELAQGQSEVDATKARIPAFEAGERQAIYRIGVLLGDAPGAVAKQLESHKPIPLPPVSIAVGLPADLLRRRADVRQAERQVCAANARIGAAIAEKYPRFSLSGNFGYRSTESHNLFDNPSNFFSIFPAVSLPLFQGGRLDANVEAARAREEQSLLAFQQTFLLAMEEVESTIARYTREQTRRDSLKASVDSAAKALRLSQSLYEQGLTDFLNVLVSERVLLQRQIELVASEAQVSLESVALYKSLGGGWEYAEANPPKVVEQAGAETALAAGSE